MSILRDVERQLRETRLSDLAHHCMWAGRDTPSPTVGPHSDTLGVAITTKTIDALGARATRHLDPCRFPHAPQRHQQTPNHDLHTRATGRRDRALTDYYSVGFQRFFRKGSCCVWLSPHTTGLSSYLAYSLRITCYFVTSILPRVSFHFALHCS